jgi:hypothetical protein
MIMGEKRNDHFFSLPKQELLWKRYMVQGLEAKPDLKHQRRKRPIILTIVCFLLFARVMLIAFLVAFLFMGVSNPGVREPLSQVLGVAFTLVLAGLDVFLLIAAVGLWLLKTWAWQWNMMIMGFLIVTGLWIHFTSASSLINDLTLLLNILIVFYLVHNDVRELFVSVRGTIERI